MGCEYTLSVAASKVFLAAAALQVGINSSRHGSVKSHS